MQTRVFIDSNSRVVAVYSGPRDAIEVQETPSSAVNYVDISADTYVNTDYVYRSGSFVYSPIEPERLYSDHRRENYPSIGEQMDMIWHAMDKGETPKIEPFYSSIKAVKEQFPKPVSDSTM